MDWNGDGHVDGRDSALFHMEIENGGGSGGGGSSGGGFDGGCLTWVLIGLIAFSILNWLCKVF